MLIYTSWESDSRCEFPWNLNIFIPQEYQLVELYYWYPSSLFQTAEEEQDIFINKITRQSPARRGKKVLKWHLFPAFPKALADVWSCFLQTRLQVPPKTHYLIRMFNISTNGFYLTNKPSLIMPLHLSANKQQSLCTSKQCSCTVRWRLTI